MSPKPWLVISDFDGTLSERDVVVALADEFGGTLGREPVAAMTVGQLSLREGLTALYGLFLSRRRGDLIRLATEQATLRAGAAAWLKTLAERAVPCYVVSSGLRPFVGSALLGLLPPERLIANEADWSGERLSPIWTHPCDADLCGRACGLCKATVVEVLRPPGGRVLCVGDRVTDAAGALRADRILARDRLQEALVSAQVGFTPWTTMDEVMVVTREVLVETAPESSPAEEAICS